MFVAKVKDNKIFIFIIIFFYLLLLLYNNLTPLLSDDYTYQFIYMGRYPKNNPLITSIIDIFVSMKNHYLMWGGRVVNHFLLQFIFMLGINFFNFFNSFMFILLGILIYKHIIPEKRYNYLLLLFIYAFIFLLNPDFFNTLLWKSGSANYLWSTNLILIMTLIYKNSYNKPIKDSWLNIFLLFIYGLIVGCTNENTGCALIVVNLLFIYFNHKKGNNPKWLKFNLVGIIIGYLILLLAPGNYNRNVIYPQGNNNIFEFIFDYIQVTISFIWIIFLLVILSFYLVKKYKKKEKFNIQFIFLIFSIISVISLICSPYIVSRSYFFAFIYLFIVFLLNMKLIIEKFDFIKNQKKFLLVFLILIFFSSFLQRFNEVKRENYANNQLFNCILEKCDVKIVKNENFMWLKSWISYYYGL